VRQGHGTFVRKLLDPDGVDFGDGRSITWREAVPGGCTVEVRRRRPTETVIMDLTLEELADLSFALTALVRQLRGAHRRGR
jgi:hypothetical protein